MSTFNEKRKNSAYYQIVTREWTANELTSRYLAVNAPVWADGEELTFYYEGVASKVELIQGIQLPLEQVKDSNLWTLTVHIKDLAKAIIGYGFVVDRNEYFTSTSTPITIKQWRGPEAPLPPEQSEPLEGQIVRNKLNSLWLAEATREVTVYLPPDYSAENEAKVIYMADGEAVANYAQFLEPLITRKIVPPIVVVGLHAASYERVTKTDRRAQEYLPDYSPESFEAHTKFFVLEVLPWAESTFNVSSHRANRAVFGFSNGAAFAIAMGRQHPELFGNIMAFSLGWPKQLEPLWINDVAPRHYLTAGVLEEGFRETTAKWAALLDEHKINYHYNQYIGGHDSTVWVEEFVRAVTWTFGSSR